MTSYTASRVQSDQPKLLSLLPSLLFMLVMFFAASQALAGPGGSGGHGAQPEPSSVTPEPSKVKEHAETAMGQEHAESNQAGPDGSASAPEAAKEHPHWGASPDSTKFSKVASYFGRFHPLLVHFPIALFLTAALAQFLLIFGLAPNFSDTVRFIVWLATASIVVAALLGWSHAGPQLPDEDAVMTTHRWLGTSMVIGAFLTTWLMERARSKSASKSDFLFNAALFSMALAVAVNGFLGGALAHGGLKHLLPGLA